MENKKKLIALVIGIILIILVGGLVFYLTSHLTKTTICKGKLDMITTEEVEVISSDEKVKETKTQVTYDYSDYVSDMYPISYYKDYIKNSNKFYKDINGVKASLKVKGNKVIYTVDIQYDSDYMKDLVEAGLVSTNGSYKDIEYISLQDTLKNQENAGLTCKEKIKAHAFIFLRKSTLIKITYIYLGEENRGNI